MASPSPARRIATGGLFVLLALAVIAARLMPLQTEVMRWPRPDLLACIAFAWVLRRPDTVPVLVLALVFLAADILLNDPPGLGTVLLLLGTEMLRRRHSLTRPLHPVQEWMLAAFLIFGISVLHWLVLGITVIAEPQLSQYLRQAAVTALAYPPVALLLRSFGLRLPSSMDVPQRRIRA